MCVLKMENAAVKHLHAAAAAAAALLTLCLCHQKTKRIFVSLSLPPAPTQKKNPETTEFTILLLTPFSIHLPTASNDQ